MSRLTGSYVLAMKAREYDVSVDELRGPRRTHTLSSKRQAVMFDLYTMCPHLSYPAIGKLLGNRDHTTIYAGVVRHCERNGYDYARVRRAFGSIRGGATPNAARTFSAQEYREMVRVAPV